MKRLIVLLQFSVVLSLMCFFLIVNGCKDDVNNPTPNNETYPEVGANWSGFMVYMGSEYDAYIVFQQNKAILNGHYVVTCRSCGDKTEYWFTGSINTSGKVTLKDTSETKIVPLHNWNYGLSDYTGTLNTDTLALMGGNKNLYLKKQ